MTVLDSFIISYILAFIISLIVIRYSETTCIQEIDDYCSREGMPTHIVLKALYIMSFIPIVNYLFMAGVVAYFKDKIAYIAIAIFENLTIIVSRKYRNCIAFVIKKQKKSKYLRLKVSPKK